MSIINELVQKHCPEIIQDPAPDYPSNFDRPEPPWSYYSTEALDQLHHSFKIAAQELSDEQQAGEVRDSTVMQVIAYGWIIRNVIKTKRKDMVNLYGIDAWIQMIQHLGVIARKYQVFQIWNSVSWRTFIKRLDEHFMLSKSMINNGLNASTWVRCGICGRTLTNPESKKRGIGPICKGKHGEDKK